MDNSKLVLEENQMLEYIDLLDKKILEFDECNLKLEKALVDIMMETDNAGKKKYGNEELRQYQLKEQLPADYVRRMELKREIEILRYKIQLTGLRLKNWETIKK